MEMSICGAFRDAAPQHTCGLDSWKNGLDCTRVRINACTCMGEHSNIHNDRETYVHINRESHYPTVLHIQTQFTTCMSYLFPQHGYRLFVYISASKSVSITEEKANKMLDGNKA